MKSTSNFLIHIIDHHLLRMYCIKEDFPYIAWRLLNPSLLIEIRSKRTTEAKLSKITNSKPSTDTGWFYFGNHQKWLSYQILGGKTVKNIQIDLQTKEISPLLKIWKCAMKPWKMAFLSNSRWQNRKERPNRSTNSGYMIPTP